MVSLHTGITTMMYYSCRDYVGERGTHGFLVKQYTAHSNNIHFSSSFAVLLLLLLLVGVVGVTATGGMATVPLGRMNRSYDERMLAFICSKPTTASTHLIQYTKIH